MSRHCPTCNTTRAERYFVEHRNNCVAVIDDDNISYDDLNYNLTKKTFGVVVYFKGGVDIHNNGLWVVNKERVKLCHTICENLNKIEEATK